MFCGLFDDVLVDMSTGSLFMPIKDVVWTKGWCTGKHVDRRLTLMYISGFRKRKLKPSSKLFY